jgi:hypothetical protein
MYANTMLRLAHVDNVVTIPLEALVLNGQERFVDVLDESNHVHEREVRVGLEGSKLAEIQSGLNSGERVIIGGQDKYQEGEEIDPVQTNEPASETQQETGGMIDMNGEEDVATANGPDAAEERHAGQTATQKRGANEPGVNENDSREPGAKRVGGGPH